MEDLKEFSRYITKLISLNNKIIISYIKEINYKLSENEIMLDNLVITDNEDELMLLCEHSMFILDNPNLIAIPLADFLKKRSGTKKEKAAFTYHTANVIKDTLIRIVEEGKDKIKLLGGETDANS